MVYRAIERIQHCFLPKTSPQIPGYRFAESYIAAQQVGGDYYDFVEISKNVFGLAVGDVSGKGVSAALYMAKLSSEMRFHAQGRLSPGAVLTVLNRALSEEMEGGMFVTLILLIIDPEKRSLRISSAGHFPPILRTGDNRAYELQIENDVPIGVIKDNEYGDTEYILKCGERLIVYTDGITEAMNKEGDLFGIDRLKQAIAQGGESPEKILETINQAVERHSAGYRQSDDLTMVCFAVE